MMGRIPPEWLRIAAVHPDAGGKQLCAERTIDLFGVYRSKAWHHRSVVRREAQEGCRLSEPLRRANTCLICLPQAPRTVVHVPQG